VTTTEEQAYIKRYGGRELDEAQRSGYEKWSLDFFHDKAIIADPLLQITLQVDITKALSRYREHYSDLDGASFFAYLMWHLVDTARRHPCFRYRKIAGKWYIFDEFPLVTPIAIGGDMRFIELMLEPPSQYSLEAFFNHYRNTLNQYVAEKSEPSDTFETVTPVRWLNSWFVGNLPNLQFTGFTLHKSAIDNGRPYFYFGKRYQSADLSYIPLLINFDHANLDPFLLSAFMADFQAGIEGC
jgi:chloramphenicol O-acetyltransferase